MRLLSAAAAIVALTTGACGEPEPVSEVIVEVFADPELREKADALHVVVEGDDGDIVLDRLKALEPESERLARVPIVPSGDDASRRFVFRAELRAAEAVLATLEARAGFVRGELRALTLRFDASCAGVECGPGRTCSNGECRGACFDTAPAGSTEAAVPLCRECDTCQRSCQATDGLTCGCAGDTCQAGACLLQKPVRSVAAGANHTCALLEDKTVRCWGRNRLSSTNLYGVLGAGLATQENSPQPVKVLSTNGWWKDLAAGKASTCVLDNTQRHCWGENFAGELGGAATSFEPKPIAFASTFEEVSAGSRHHCARTAKDELFCWGVNDHAQLGLGKKSSDELPTLVGNGYRQVAAGGEHSCAIDLGGRLWCWGFNDGGQVGVPGTDDVTKPARAGCDSGSEPGVCFDDWERVATGRFHTCALRKGRQLYCFGGNANGQLGIETPFGARVATPTLVVGQQRFVAVYAAGSHTCALDEEKKLWCWGANGQRQTAIPDLDKVIEPTVVPVDSTQTWARLSLGPSHGCTVRDDQSLYCWGANDDGQLGRGSVTAEPSAAPRRVCFTDP